MNKKTVERIKRRRYEAALKEERRKMAEDPDYIQNILDPEDFASGGIAGGGRTSTGLNYLVGEDDQNVRMPVNQGGRIPFAMGKRAFLKWLGSGIAGITAAKTGLLGFLKGGGKKSVIAPATQHLNKIVDGVDGMPAWFKPLINKVIKEGDDVTKGFATQERQIVHKAKLPDSQTDVLVTQDLTTGDVAVDIGASKHGFGAGHHGQPVRLSYKASEWIEPSVSKSGKKLGGKKTKEDFWVEEAEFTGGHPENVKFEESSFNKFGQHGSNFDEVEKFATGKIKKKTAKESIKAERAHWTPEGDYASGGRVPLSGGLLAKGIGKFSKAEVLIKMIENTIKGSKDSYVKKTFPNFIKELRLNPKLANDPKVWSFFTNKLPQNQRLVVHSDDTVDFWTQSDFGPHNIKTTDKFHKKHPYLTRDQAVKIQNMEPEDQILEMKRLETIRNRTNNATGGRVPMIFGGSPGLKAMYQSVLKNLSKSQKKKISSFFPKMSAAEKQLIKLGETVDPRAFHALNTREMNLKLEGIEHLISRLKQDKQMMEQVAENKAMKDEGLDFLMKHMEETDMIPKYLHKYTDIDKDILTMETIKKNLIMKDRKLNATGGLATMLGE